MIGEKYLGGNAARYVRRYLEPFPPGTAADFDYDVVMEIWFPDQAALDAAFEGLQDAAAAAEIAEDEERLFERAAIRTFLVDERESTLPRVASHQGAN